MELKEIGEFGFIDRICEGCLIRREGIILPIGDDAAVYTHPEEQVSLLTTDLLVERVHFNREAISPEDLGHKALAVNLSDIAAMGGTARDAFVSIAVPQSCSLAYLEALYTGMRDLAARFDVNILGGDTTGSKQDLIINIAVTGTAAPDALLLRKAARPGDAVFTTGFPGESRAGLHLILNRIETDTPALAALRNAHLRPRPYLDEGRFLAGQAGIHAGIDVSDGLVSDLGHILRASGCGARLDAGRIPVSGNLKTFCTRYDLDPVSFALSGGEDYTLLCTAAGAAMDRIKQAYEAGFDSPLFVIGEITDGEGITLVSAAGEETPVTETGWDHFKQGETP